MKVVRVFAKADWDDALRRLDGHDFMHTFDFHSASHANGEGEPLAFVAYGACDEVEAFWPALRRDIPDSDAFDLTSVYGYAGPLLKNGSDTEAALTAIFKEMREYGAVSLFSRMHPLFIDQIPDSPLRGQKLSDVVVIDVRPVEDVLSQYRGSHRREIVNARKAGVSVVVDSGDSALVDFSRIYRQSMSDLNAKSYYYFSDAYFERIVSAADFKTLILFAEMDGRRIATSLFLVTGSVMQYYLSGTDAGFRKLAPSKAIIAKAHELAMTMGVRHIVLGGGVGSAHDALFKFKTGFSSTFMPFYVTKKILDEPRYQTLCAAHSLPSESSFFPAYRA
jgi:hypothetical protein